MNKGELKSMLAALDAAGVADSCPVKFQKLDTGRLDVDGGHFILEGQDASYSIDATDHWAPSVSQPSAFVLKQE